MPFADIESKNSSLIRKGLRAAVFVAPYSTAALTTIMDGAGDLAALPVGYSALGSTSEDGLTWPRETELSEIYAHGEAEPARSDVRRAVKRFTVNALETNRTTLEQYLGIDLSAVTTSLTDKESTWDEPSLPVYPYQRMIAIAQDLTELGEVYLGRHFLRARVTEVGEQTWSDADQAMVYPLTYTAFFDSTAGTGSRWFEAGPGRDPEAEGFPAPA